MSAFDDDTQRDLPPSEPVSNKARTRFDALMQEAIDRLPAQLHTLIEQVPIIVDDEPSPELMAQLEIDFQQPAPSSFQELCGLHSGLAITERSVEDPTGLPEDIHLFRRGVIWIAGGWHQPDADGAIYEEIVVTLLHEIGHHFGLSEQELAALGYD